MIKMTNEFTKLLKSLEGTFATEESNMKKSIKQLGDSFITASQYVNDFSVSQDEFNAMVTGLLGDVGYDDNINTAEFAGMDSDDISNTDVLYYLEEMIQCGLADEIEENVYYDIKWFGRCKRGEMKHVKKNMIKMYNEKF